MVNTSFILDMQPKLYRWSASDKGKTFFDLFNLICDRRTLIEGDIKGCFDAINHHLLMEEVKRRIRDRKVLLLIRSFLKADIMIEGSLEHSATGTPQGGVLSPLLANIFLHRLDESYDRWMPRPRENPTNAVGRRRFDRRHGKPTFYMVRYADDFVLLVVGSRQQAEAEREALTDMIDMRRELVQLEALIDWTFFEAEWAVLALLLEVLAMIAIQTEKRICHKRPQNRTSHPIFRTN